MRGEDDGADGVNGKNGLDGRCGVVHRKMLAYIL